MQCGNGEMQTDGNNEGIRAASLHLPLTVGSNRAIPRPLLPLIRAPAERGRALDLLFVLALVLLVERRDRRFELALLRVLVLDRVERTEEVERADRAELSGEASRERDLVRALPLSPPPR